MHTEQKNRFAAFISISLAVLILAVAGVGFYTYNSLNKVVDQLRYESYPNFNIIAIKDIMASITGIEHDLESYLLTEDEMHKNRYDQRISDAKIFLDSLRKMNQDDPDFLRFTDSLHSLINQKVAILGELQELASYNLSGSINDLAKRLDQLPVKINGDSLLKDSVVSKNDELALADDSIIISGKELAESDTLSVNEEEEKKKGLWKSIVSIFSKNKDQKENQVATVKEKAIDSTDVVPQNLPSDSALVAQKTQEYRKQLQLELIQLRNESREISKDIRERELELAQNQQVIQSRIIDILTYLEDREVDKIKLMNYNAQLIADRTTDQVIVFSLLTILLLFATGYVAYSYIEKNKAYQRVLSQATLDAENLAKSKEQFLANMSHEIRTPMNAISGFTEQLLKTDMTVSQRESLDIIHRSSNHLLHILNDVLDFSKLQADKLTLEDIPYDLPQLMSDAVKLMLHKAQEKGLAINYVSENIPKFIFGDPYRFKQIIINLVSNSIKFTDKGKIDIHLTAKKRNRVNELQLIVEDTGIGIPKDQQSRIMMEFEQVGKSSNHTGTGLGLSITKKLVELHQGKMNLESEVDKGTKITVSIPYVKAEDAPQEMQKDVVSLDLRDVNILIADDEPFNIKLLTAILDNKGARWVTCKDGREALKELNRTKFDIALLDLKMPHLSGIDVAKSLRSRPGPNYRTPLVALTATIMKEDIDQCMKYGIDHVVRKPYSEEQLFEVIASELKIYSEVKDNHSEVKGTTDHKSFDLTDLRELGDEAFVIDMLETFLNNSKPGTQNIQQYYRRQEWINLADEAHKIVAPARYLNAVTLVNQLKAIEFEARKEDPQISHSDIEKIIKSLNKLNHELSQYLLKEQV